MSRNKGRETGTTEPVGDQHADAGSPATANGSPSCSWIPAARGGGDGGYLAAFDAAFRSSYPTLFDFLSLQGMGGKARKTGTLTVFLADGKFKGSLNDREESYTGFASADSFTGLLEALDKGLKSGHLDWRPSRKFKG